ncbi:hypothetical protein P5V15_014059 [Pogonomyrmex californicus]
MLLHPEEQSSVKKPSELDGNAETNQSVTLTSTVNNSQWSSSRVILSTAHVWIHDNKGARVEYRILLDSGSQFNFISREICERLKLNTQRQSCSVKNLGSSIELHETVRAVIQSKYIAYCAKFLVVFPRSKIDNREIAFDCRQRRSSSNAVTFIAR